MGAGRRLQLTRLSVLTAFAVYIFSATTSAFTREHLRPGLRAMAYAGSSLKTPNRIRRSADGSSHRKTGSFISCYLLSEKQEWRTVTRRVRILHLCNTPELPFEWKLECHKRHMQYSVWSNAVAKNGKSLTVKVLYTERRLVKTLHRETPGRPNYLRRLNSRFHWIDWNATVEHLDLSANTTHIRCEWRFDTRTAHGRPKYASLSLLEKIWAKRASTGPTDTHDGCRREDGRLTLRVTRSNHRSRPLSEKTRYCSRRNLPSQFVKKFYANAEIVRVSFRAHVDKLNVGPFGFFFSFADNFHPGCPRTHCRKQERRKDYGHCRNSSLPPFLRISVGKSIRRVYSTSEIQQGLEMAFRLRRKNSPAYPCIERYPVFRDFLSTARWVQSNHRSQPTRPEGHGRLQPDEKPAVKSSRSPDLLSDDAQAA